MIKISLNKLVIYIVTILILFLIPICTIVVNFYTINTGEIYLFKVRTYDPYDMLRGNYLNIQFDKDFIISNEIIDDTKDVYLELGIDNDGFAYFKNISNNKPKDSNIYFKTKCYYNKYSKEYKIDTPNRYYMNENKSKLAEELYKNNLDNAYIKVSVKNGHMNIL